MSGIAEVLLNLGYRVSGSDAVESANVKRLRSLGATVYLGHAAENVQNSNVLVVSTAISEDNPELVAARERKIPIVPRAVMLAELMRFRHGVGIAGTHGKTTTTSLVASVMGEGGLDPTFVIGGKLTSAGVNARLGQGDYIVAEADESDASFLHLSVVIAVITNIDQDHMDTYGHDFNKLKDAFVAFTRSIPFYGAAVVCIDDANVREIVPNLQKTVITYGLSEDAQVRAYDVVDAHGKMRFKVSRTGFGEELPVLDVTLNLPGLHNVRNALAAIAVGTEVDVDDAAILKALAEFNGVGRRFQRYGQVKVPEQRGGGEFTLIDDYGHHPVEMAATLSAARGAFPNQRIVLAFQPHRYTRTKLLLDQYGSAFAKADKLIVTDVYSAGEDPIPGVSGELIAKKVKETTGQDVTYIPHKEDLVAYLKENSRPLDLVITMGAGDIYKVGEAYLAEAKEMEK